MCIRDRVHAPADPDALSVEEMVEMVKQAGIVGMGGATFPTHTKISSGSGKVDVYKRQEFNPQGDPPSSLR